MRVCAYTIYHNSYPFYVKKYKMILILTVKKAFFHKNILYFVIDIVQTYKSEKFVRLALEIKVNMWYILCCIDKCIC